MNAKTSERKKIYRFALYGATNSGKTVLLAALADHNPVFTSSFSCNFIAIGQQENKPSKHQADRYQALLEGQKWLDESRKALSQGELPKPTPPDHPDMLFEFDFSDGQRTYCIELTDYSGESIDPTLSSDERATRLRQQLKDKDALLILAPVPSNSGNLDDLDGQRLARLRESFSLLTTERKDDALHMPVAMLVTKWDRFISNDDYNLEKAQARLQAFLDQQPPPPHRSLWSALRGATSNPERDFEIFPISALGQCDSDGRPLKYNPLYTFGLEAPFLWAAQRHDEIELEDYEDKIGALNFLEGSKTWLRWPRPIKLRKLSRLGSRLVRSLPTVDPLHDKAKQLCSKVARAYRYSQITSLVGVFLAVVAVETGIDYSRYQTLKQTINDPKADAQQVQQAENWLKNYSQSVFPRHLLSTWITLSRGQAEARLADLRSGRDEIYWLEVVNAGPEQKMQHAETYLAAFPNGRHRAEAIVLLAESTDRMNWEKFISLYQATLQAGKTVEASTILSKRDDDPRAAEFVRNFESTAFNVLEDRIKTAVQKQDIEQAKNLIAQVQQWPLAFRTAGGTERENMLKKVVNLAEDRLIYNDAREYKNLDQLSQYLNLSPRGRMHKDIQAYMDWLDAQTQSMPLDIYVKSIKWDDESGKNGGIQLTVWVNDIKAIQLDQLTSKSSKTDNINSSVYRFNARLDEKIRIRVEVEDTDKWFSSSKIIGSGVKSTLVKGVSGLRVSASGEKLNTVVIFGLTGIQQEPVLPLWREE